MKGRLISVYTCKSCWRSPCRDGRRRALGERGDQITKLLPTAVETFIIDDAMTKLNREKK